jgi:hypothetical protein
MVRIENPCAFTVPAPVGLGIGCRPDEYTLNGASSNFRVVVGDESVCFAADLAEA